MAGSNHQQQPSPTAPRGSATGYIVAIAALTLAIVGVIVLMSHLDDLVRGGPNWLKDLFDGVSRAVAMGLGAAIAFGIALVGALLWHIFARPKRGSE